jgi:glucose/arabinose dehydrogenase
MKSIKQLIRIAVCFAVLAGLSGSALSQNVSVFADGLNGPRGMKFGPDGNLYVAEAGLGGTLSTVGQCEQVPPPVGPSLGGFTARISRITPEGVRTTVVDNLPSRLSGVGDYLGVADVAFIGDTLYALLAGAGCSHGLAGTSNGVIRVNPDGTWTQIADLSAFLHDNPVLHRETDDFEPDGSWYSMVAVRGYLYATEPNNQEVVRISPDTGQVTRVVDMSVLTATSGQWAGPTAMAYDGNFYVGDLTTFPITPGNAKVFKLTPSGEFKVWAEGFSTILGLAVDNQGQLYVLESMTAAGFPGPAQVGTGRIVRLNHSGSVETIATGLSFPSAMTFGPDGALYVSNFGFGPPVGQIVRVTFP